MTASQISSRPPTEFRNDPVQMLVAAWPGTATAERALHELQTMRQSRSTGGLVHAAAVAVAVAVDGVGRMRVIATRDDPVGRAATLEGVLAAGLGLVTRGIGWLQVDGGVIGAQAAVAADGGLPEDRIRAVGERMPRRSSAVVAVVDTRWADMLARRFTATGGDVVREVVDQGLVVRLRLGWAVAHHLTTRDEVLAIRSDAAVMRVLDVFEGATA